MSGDHDMYYGPTTEDLALDFWERCYVAQMRDSDGCFRISSDVADDCDLDLIEWRKRWDRHEQEEGPQAGFLLCLATNGHGDICTHLVGHAGLHSSPSAMWANDDTKPATAPETVESLLRELGHTVSFTWSDAREKLAVSCRNLNREAYADTALDALIDLRDHVRGAK